MTKFNKIVLGIKLFIMVLFLIEKSLIIFNFIPESDSTHLFEYICFLLFLPPSFIFIRGVVMHRNEMHTKTIEKLENKNTYLEHAAKILRHDMHSGINVYLPRGVSSLERRLPKEIIKQYKLEQTIRLIREGLEHTQKIYKGVYEFTNLVKTDVKIDKKPLNIGVILRNYLALTAYKEQVVIDFLPEIPVNEPLFCTAIDNLIRNGLKYNDSENKLVVVYMFDDNHIAIQDNGRGMTSEEFLYLSKFSKRKEGQKEKGSGLGLGICVAILKEHGFTAECEKIDEGTRIKIKIK